MNTTYVISYDIAAIFIGIIIILEYNIRSTIRSRQTHAFLELLVTAILATALDIGSTLALTVEGSIPSWFNPLLASLFQIAFQALTPMYLYYIMCSGKREEDSFAFPSNLIVIVPYTIDLILIFVNPILVKFCGDFFVYNITAEGYQSGNVRYVFYGIAVFYVVCAIVYVIRQRHVLVGGQKMIVVVYTSLISVAILVQLLHPELLIINFAAMLSIMIMAFTMESPAYYEEQQLGIYNRFAFQTVCSKNIANGHQFSVLGIRIDGLMDLRELVGIVNISNTLKDVSKYLLSISDKNSVFSVSESQFALIIEGGESEIEMFVKKIRRRFESPFGIVEEGLHLNVSMSRFSFPKDVQSTESVMDLLEYSLLKSENSKDPVLVANSDLLEEKQRMSLILQILKKALVENRFSVYYQPIFSVEKESFTAAEALLRLYDDELGFISPDEFVPIAEKNGLILKIGEYVFREVCRFASENKIWEKGIEHIDVNLSTMQCLQENLSEVLIGIMDEYNLDYSRVSLEITETASIISGKVLLENMQSFIEKGMRFSLDDYGTGYANITTVVEYPFSIVKLDKAMLWTAMKNDKAMTVLRQTIRMMKQLSLDLIAEGVETEEQAQLLAYYGCDYFQGYLYAKPQNSELFLKLLDSRQNVAEA